MRVDEAIQMLAARAAIVKRASASRPQSQVQSDSGGWEHRSDGSKVMRINSMEGLRNFLGAKN